MDGFKNTTKMKYMGAGGMVDGYSMGGHAKGGNVKPMMKGGDAKPMMAKGGNAKVGAKISKVMGEFKKGDLHSGSKDGPKVKSPKQAMAIALSEAGKGKMPMKKNEGGKIGKMPPLGESVKSGNRMSKMTAAEMREMEERFGNKRRPSPGDSVKSGNRIAKEEADEARHFGVFKKGGKVRKYAEGGAVEPVENRKMALPVDVTIPPEVMNLKSMPIEPAMLPSRSQVSTEGMTPEQFLKFQYEQERAIHSDPSSPFHSMYFPSVAPPKMISGASPEMGVVPPQRPQKIYEPRRPPGASSTSKLIEQGLQRIQQKQRPGMDRVDPGFAIDRGGYDMTAPPAGMAPVDPNKAMMMRHGGRAAMPKRGR